jgi:hypothetical protein
VLLLLAALLLIKPGYVTDAIGLIAAGLRLSQQPVFRDRSTAGRAGRGGKGGGLAPGARRARCWLAATAAWSACKACSDWRCNFVTCDCRTVRAFSSEAPQRPAIASRCRAGPS